MKMVPENLLIPTISLVNKNANAILIVLFKLCFFKDKSNILFTQKIPLEKNFNRILSCAIMSSTLYLFRKMQNRKLIFSISLYNTTLYNFFIYNNSKYKVKSFIFLFVRFIYSHNHIFLVENTQEIVLKVYKFAVCLM